MRAARHPEARLAALRAQSSAESVKRLPIEGWRWRYGWTVKLIGMNGTKHFRHSETYEEAVALRDAELKDGRYEVAWLEQKENE